jgi:hypothetical protein
MDFKRSQILEIPSLADTESPIGVSFTLVDLASPVRRHCDMHQLSYAVTSPQCPIAQTHLPEGRISVSCFQHPQTVHLVRLPRSSGGRYMSRSGLFRRQSVRTRQRKKTQSRARLKLTVGRKERSENLQTNLLLAVAAASAALACTAGSEWRTGCRSSRRRGRDDGRDPA